MKYYSIYFGKSISIGQSSNDDKFELFKDKNGNFEFNYDIKIKNISINAYEIISLIFENKEESDKYKINYDDHEYPIFFKKENITIKFQDLFLYLFEKIKSFVPYFDNIIIVFEKDIPYNLKIIIKIVGVLLGFKIFNFLDTFSAIRYYLEMKGNKFSDCFGIINENDNNNICIYVNDNKIQKTFGKLNNLNKCLNQKEIIKIEKEKELDQENFAILQNIIVKDIGKQIFEINELYYCGKNENNYLSKIICIGSMFSKSLPIIQESQIIINFIDFCNLQKNNFISKIQIADTSFSVSSETIKITIESIIPYTDCFYITVPLKIIFKDRSNYSAYITVYFGQINYFYMSISSNYRNSNELIFYKKYPKITIGEFNVNYHELFDNKSFFKRINLININYDILKIEGIENEDIFYLDDEISKLIIVNSDLNILSSYEKSLTKNIIVNSLERKKILINLFSESYIISSKLSREDIKNKYKKLLLKLMGNLINYHTKLYMKNDNANLDNYDAQIFKYYWRVNLYNKIFGLYDFNFEKKYELFIKIFKNIEYFEEKCKIIKDEILEAKLFATACFILYKNMNEKNRIEEILHKDKLFELLDFSEDTIYKAANTNNIEFISKLTHNSYIYNYILQINSSNKEVEFENNQKFKVNMVSMLTIQQLKYDLYKSLPKYGIRVFYNFEDDYAATSLNTGVTLYNEPNIFGKELSDEELLCENDVYYQKRVCLSIIQKHERFTHLKKIFNKNEKDYLDSPLGFLDFNSGRIIKYHCQYDSKKGEIGESFENIYTNNNRKLIVNLFKIKNVNMKNLFNNDLWLNEKNDELIKELKAINGNNINDNKTNEININKEKSDSNLKHLINPFVNDNNRNINDFSETNIIEERDGFIYANGDKMTKEEYDFEKRKIEILNEKNIFKLTHTFKGNTLRSTIIKPQKAQSIIINFEDDEY